MNFIKSLNNCLSVSPKFETLFSAIDSSNFDVRYTTLNRPKGNNPLYNTAQVTPCHHTPSSVLHLTISQDDQGTDIAWNSWALKAKYNCIVQIYAFRGF